MKFRVGVDVGGTFTDVVVVDGSGEINVFKVSSTPEDQSRGVLNGLEKAANEYNMSLERFLKNVETLGHGTTVSTNACLEREGAKTGLITTEGFRDALEMRRAHKKNIWDLSEQHPPVLVPRHLRRGVSERINSEGEVVEPLDEENVRQVIGDFRDEDVESIAVSTLFSFKNDTHERRIKEIVNEEFPEAFVSVSSEITRQIREYERTSTTVLNSYTGPLLTKYLENLKKALSDSGYERDIFITQSNGGVIPLETAQRQAAATLYSGPASGVIGGQFLANLLDIGNIIVCDMGGTSFDVTLLHNFGYTLTTEGEIGGYRSILPTIDIHTIGAGGGSIAYIDEGGMLRVGEKSAGADPGPVCYGRGGEEPTCTDAQLILGFLNPDYFAGGDLELDYGGAYEAIEENIADPLGVSVEEAASNVFKVINSKMADAIRVVSVERGYDPRNFYILAAGGAGPAHAAKLSQIVGVPKVVVPSAASVFCALGMLTADVRHSYVRTFSSSMSGLDVDRLNDVFGEMEEEGRETLLSEGVSSEQIKLKRSLDMRYTGQHHEVTVDIPSGETSESDLEDIENRFHNKHKKLFTYSEPETEVEILNARIAAIGEVPIVEMREEEEKGPNPDQAYKNTRDVYFEDGMMETPVYNRNKLRNGNIVESPAVIEESTTTIIVPPGWQAKVDEYENVILEGE